MCFSFFVGTGKQGLRPLAYQYRPKRHPNWPLQHHRQGLDPVQLPHIGRGVYNYSPRNQERSVSRRCRRSRTPSHSRAYRHPQTIFRANGGTPSRLHILPRVRKAGPPGRIIHPQGRISHKYLLAGSAEHFRPDRPHKEMTASRLTQQGRRLLQPKRSKQVVISRTPGPSFSFVSSSVSS